MAEEHAFDATDAVAEANANREIKRREREDADVWRRILHSKQGRAWLYRRLERCHIYASTFVPGQSDVTAFQLGEENIGKRLMLEAQDASPDLYVQMLKEQREEEKRLDEVRRTEQKRREEAERSPTPEEMMGELPPPAGWPGGPPMAKKK
jgi:hypothetical protein